MRLPARTSDESSLSTKVSASCSLPAGSRRFSDSEELGEEVVDVVVGLKQILAPWRMAMRIAWLAARFG